MNKYMWGGMGLALLLLISTANAATVQGKAGDTVVVDEAFELQKPDSRWDTQKLNRDPNMPARWVLHQTGKNPIMQLKYLNRDIGYKGKALSDAIAFLKKQYRDDGTIIKHVEQKKMNGKNVALLHGWNPYDGTQFLISVWHEKNKSYVLECSSDKNDFQAFRGEFEKAIESARILK